MFPSSRGRVPENTADEVNDQIRQDTQRNIALYASAGKEAIDRRLEELDREWDIERAIEAQAAGVSLAALGLSATVSRKFLVVPVIVGGFLLMHALQGWCPPIPILRRLGFRTRDEIDEERYALKAIRGDFKEIEATSGYVSVDEAGKVMDVLAT
jgi:hypothetical protein